MQQVIGFLQVPTAASYRTGSKNMLGLNAALASLLSLPSHFPPIQAAMMQTTLPNLFQTARWASRLV